MDARGRSATARFGSFRSSRSCVSEPEKKVPTLSDLKAARPVAIADGSAVARARAADVDRAIVELVSTAFEGTAAVAAVGGYGRGEISPHSDIDLLLIVSPKSELNQATLRNLLYPLWDAGFHVGHAVRTAKEAIERAGTDLHTATSLLSARFIAGDATVFEELLDRRGRWLRKDARKLTRRILDETRARHQRVDRAGWSLAPDLKEDIGGLRDVHTVTWLQQVVDSVGAGEPLMGPSAILMAVREALHAESKRPGDRIHIELQPAIAARLGISGPDRADELMEKVHRAARAIEHGAAVSTESLSERALGGPKRSGSTRPIAPGVIAVDGYLVGDKVVSDVPDALRVLAAMSSTGLPIDRRALGAVSSAFSTEPLARWDEETKNCFGDLLRGAHAAAALELLDHRGGWPALMPEWIAVRGRAQHDPYHRYTVDGHSFLAVEELTRAIQEEAPARAAADELGDLTPLYVGTLLHDCGKGSGEDHSVAGARIAAKICARMGLDAASTDFVTSLVRHHLLLPDTATRRDLDDGAVIEFVADTVGDPNVLRGLYLLAIADGRSTGPEAWNPWKASLVWDLYRKTLVALETGEVPPRGDVAERAAELVAFEPTLAASAGDLLATLPPSYLAGTPVPDMADELRLLLQAPGPGEARLRVEDGPESNQATTTICVIDRPGTLARSAGVFALHRISVLRAQAYSTTTGLALERFIVTTDDRTNWDGFESDLRAAYAGRLALEARLEKKIRDYRASGSIEPEVRVLQDESHHSTVVEVRAPDALGLLYAITSGLSDLDLDIHVAKIDTLGARVVDVFYVRTLQGEKLDAAVAAEVEQAVSHRVRRLLG